MAAVTDKRQEVHSLIDHLRPAQLIAVRDLLESMVDPVARSIALAPVDDEAIARWSGSSTTKAFLTKRFSVSSGWQ